MNIITFFVFACRSFLSSVETIATNTPETSKAKIKYNHIFLLPSFSLEVNKNANGIDAIPLAILYSKASSFLELGIKMKNIKNIIGNSSHIPLEYVRIRVNRNMPIIEP